MKKCPTCGHKYDDALVSCPKCVSEGTTPSSLSEKQWEAVNTWHNELHKKNRKICWIIITVVVLVFPLSIWGIYWSAVRSIKGVIVERVAQEFNEPRIRITVEDVARARASELMEKEIAPNLVSFRKDVNSYLDNVKRQSASTLSELKQLNTFLITVARAEGDERKAFEKLEAWADDKAFPLHEQAFQAYRRVYNQHNQPAIRKWPVQWKEGTDPSQLTLVDLQRNYTALPPLSYLKPALIYYVYERTDLPKNGKLEFFAKIQKEDDSLTAMEYAGRCFNNEAGTAFHPLGVKERLEWWEKNKDSLE